MAGDPGVLGAEDEALAVPGDGGDAGAGEGVDRVGGDLAVGADAVAGGGEGDGGVADEGDGDAALAEACRGARPSRDCR